MSNFADAPLEKVTLNLYLRDVQWFREHHRDNYTLAIRRVVTRHVNEKLQEELRDERERSSTE